MGFSEVALSFATTSLCLCRKSAILPLVRNSKGLLVAHEDMPSQAEIKQGCVRRRQVVLMPEDMAGRETKAATHG